MIYKCKSCGKEFTPRPVIRKMLEKVAADPAIDINELIKKEYPKI